MIVYFNVSLVFQCKFGWIQINYAGITIIRVLLLHYTIHIHVPTLVGSLGSCMVERGLMALCC